MKNNSIVSFVANKGGPLSASMERLNLRYREILLVEGSMLVMTNGPCGPESQEVYKVASMRQRDRHKYVKRTSQCILFRMFADNRNCLLTVC